MVVYRFAYLLSLFAKPYIMKAFLIDITNYIISVLVANDHWEFEQDANDLVSKNILLKGA